MEARITGRTRLLGLIGSPVAHSGSPAMYNYAFARLGVDYAYLAFDIPPQGVAEAMAAIRTLNMKGFNITMPHKVAILPYLDGVAPEVELIGAANTVVQQADGRYIGYNTDGKGFVYDLEAHGYSIKGKKLLILGAGGASTSIQAQCALDGAAGLWVFNRKSPTFDRALAMADKIRAAVPGCPVQVCDLADRAALLAAAADCDILINTTSVGMHPHADSCPVADEVLDALRPGTLVSDIIYNPPRTLLLEKAAARGCPTVNGKGMLLWQGVEAFRLYTGITAPVKEVREKYFAE